MEDIETDGEAFAHHRQQHLPNMPDKSTVLNSYDEQVDSGLGSLAYYSGEIDRISVPEDSKDSSAQAKDSSASGHLGSLDIALSRLNIVGSHSSQDRCDSGLDEGIDGEHFSSSDFSSKFEPRVSPNVNIFSFQQVADIFSADEDGDNHLHLSIIHGLPELSMQIIGLAPHWELLNQTNNLQQTPLHIAVLTNQVAVARRLVCAGATVDVRDQFGNTPLHSACGLGYEEMVHSLTTPVKYEETCQNKYRIPFQRVPQDLEIRNYEGLTCFHLAAIGSHFNIMRILLKAGADINAAEGKSGRTALHLAADWGNLAMTNFLLSYKTIKINEATYSGLTAVLLAYGRQHSDVVSELFNHGATMDPLTFSEDLDAESSDEEMGQDVRNGSLTSSPRRQYQMACS